MSMSSIKSRLGKLARSLGIGAPPWGGRPAPTDTVASIMAGRPIPAGAARAIEAALLDIGARVVRAEEERPEDAAWWRDLLEIPEGVTPGRVADWALAEGRRKGMTPAELEILRGWIESSPQAAIVRDRPSDPNRVI